MTITMQTCRVPARISDRRRPRDGVINASSPFQRVCRDAGALALVQDGDIIEIDIPARTIHLAIDAEELAARRTAMNGLPADRAWQPQGERSRVVTRALKAYAAFATSADRGGFREVCKALPPLDGSLRISQQDRSGKT